MVGYKCKCGGTNVEYYAQMEVHQSEVTYNKEIILSKEQKPTEKGKNLLFCPKCGRLGYMDDFEVMGE